MFKKEFQEQLESVRNSSAPSEMIFDVDDHKFKFIMDNNKIRVLKCPVRDNRVQDNKQIQVSHLLLMWTVCETFREQLCAIIWTSKDFVNFYELLELVIELCPIF